MVNLGQIVIISQNIVHQSGSSTLLPKSPSLESRVTRCPPTHLRNGRSAPTTDGQFKIFNKVVLSNLFCSGTAPFIELTPAADICGHPSGHLFNKDDKKKHSRRDCGGSWRLWDKGGTPHIAGRQPSGLPATTEPPPGQLTICL